MSGSSLPYHLRPHKAVDRRLFVDLLSRYERWQSLANHAYLSMGAYPLEDHKLIHRVVGITRLIAFDFEQAVVARQSFNKPVDTCRCIVKSAGEVAENVDGILRDCDIADASGVIVWLDYTDPKKIGQQIREFQTLLDQLSEGDIVRITVNAHPNGLLPPKEPGEKPLLAADRMKKQFDALKSRIGEFLPTSASEEDMTLEGLPLVLSQAFAAAAIQALPPGRKPIFNPLSIVRYADGVQMLSITGVVLAKGRMHELQARLDMKSWPFASADWATVHQLVVPALTLRERLFLERGIFSRPADDLIQELGFDEAADVSVRDFLESYKAYYRFYPTLLSAEL